MGKQHIIELNGKRYDASTGELVIDESVRTTTHHSKPLRTQVRTMDGIAKRRPSPTHARPLEKSHTLMRKTVNKPVHQKVHAVATIVDLKPAQTLGGEQPHPKAKAGFKRGLIQKFAPFKADETSQIVSPDVAKTRTKAAALSQTMLEAAAVVVNPLEQAIARARSHEQPKLKRPGLHKRVAHKLHVSPKVISRGAGVLAFILLVGFFGYQNLPNLKMRLAANRAGVHGTLPAYQPAGFRMVAISYKTGQINIGYRSNSDDRNFTITQIASAWNSDTLREKLRDSGQTSNTVEVPDKGKTLFIYNDSNVTWVDGGILYSIEGNSKLTSEQLLHMANSL